MDKTLVASGNMFSEVEVAVFKQQHEEYAVQNEVILPGPKSVATDLTADKVPLDNRINFLAKCTFDFVIAFLLTLTILSWLIPVIAALIKIDSRGPVFFLQRRNKKNGRIFNCIKFRTMHHSATNKQVTRLGKFLRYHHIDELPQLVNVLAGDMSVIGPRPHMVSENLEYSRLLPQYNYRHRVKPGITGLAQSLGNFGAINDLKKIEKRINLDVEYIVRWSFRMDLRIIYRTFCLVVRSVFIKHES